MNIIISHNGHSCYVCPVCSDGPDTKKRIMQRNKEAIKQSSLKSQEKGEHE